MSSSPQSSDPQKQRFDNYEVDSRAGELRKHGYRVPLEDRPFRALEILLKHAPEVVTREELKKQLWAEDVFVDFDHGLNKVIGKVRRALSDSADQPRFVETVGRRGYRFIAPIYPPITPARQPHLAVVEPPVPVIATERPRRRRRTLYVTAAAVVAVLVVAFLLRPTTPKLHVAQIVQVTKSGEAWPLEPMFTDGPRLYFQGLSRTETPPKWQIKQVLLNGNEESVIANSGPVHSLRIRGLSPDYTEFLALVRNGDEWTHATAATMPVVGGPTRPLGNVFADDVAWSHDGEMLVYSNGAQIHLAKGDGSGAHLLIETPGDVAYLAFSPDDQRISFTVMTEQQELWEVRTDGRGLHPRRLNWPGKPVECCGTWTPDGRYFVFRSKRNGVANVWAVEEKSSGWRRANAEPAQLTFGPMNFSQPLPSRNGKVIYAVGSLTEAELVQYDAKKKDFVPFLRALSADYVSISRDGQWVAYVSLPERTLWRARVDGSEAFQLTLPPLQVDSQPRWSNDGTRIVIAGRKPGELLSLYTISLADGKVESLPNPKQSMANPDWMPDQNSLVYGNGLDQSTDFALYRFDLRTLRSEKISGTEGLFDPVWSPDGKKLVAVDVAKGSLFLVDLTGKRTQLDRPAYYPVWSADSQYVYYAAADHVLMRVRVADGKVQKVLTVNFRLASGSFSLTRDGAPIFVREHGHSDVYALSLAQKER